VRDLRKFVDELVDLDLKRDKYVDKAIKDIHERIDKRAGETKDLKKEIVIAVVVCDYFLARRCYFFLFLSYFFSFSFLTISYFDHMTKEKTSIQGTPQEHWCLQPSPPADKTSNKKEDLHSPGGRG